MRHYVNDSAAKYRLIAKAKSTTARLDGREDQTSYLKRLKTVDAILSNSDEVVALRTLSLSHPTTAIDVGCGSGGFFSLISEKMGGAPARVIGILPSKEEFLFLSRTDLPPNVELAIGTSEWFGAVPQRVDFVFCNSVLHGSGFSPAKVEASLREFRSRLDVGGLLFVGEIPDELEAGQSGGAFHDEVFAWFRLARLRSRDRFVRRGVKLFRSFFSKDLEVVSRAPGFHSSSLKFVQTLDEAGFELIGIFDSSNGESVEPRDSHYGLRLDYLARAR